MQYFSILALALAAAAFTNAAPADLQARHRRVCKTDKTITANFDDQNYLLGAALPALQAVGTYDGLTYNGFVGLQSTTGTGILPHSTPNEIVTGLPQMLEDGTAYIEATGTTTYFDFHGFYFGCALDTVSGLVGVPQACTVTITGYYEGKQLAVQEFNFSPTGVLSSSQTQAEQKKAECHTSFTGVDKVEFTTDNPTVLVLLLDDITYTPHTCSS